MRGKNAPSALWVGFLLVLIAYPAGAQTTPPAARAEAAVRVAVLTGEGERKVADVPMAQVEAALTGVKEITLLERAQIQKILAEQKLSASGLADPATAVKLGRLLPVDLFLLLERIPKSQPAICRAQCIEAQTGIVLAAGWLDASQLAGPAVELKTLLAAATARQRIPPDARHYVGILGVRNEEPGRALDDAAEALEMLLSADLQAQPELVLLDREHLDLLRQEESLAGVWVRLKGSTQLLGAGLRRSEDGKSLEISLRLNSATGGEPVRLKAGAPKGDVPALRRAAADAVISALKLRPQAREAGNLKREAGLFDREYTARACAGDHEAAKHAIQAAAALAPNNWRRDRVAEILGEEASTLWNGQRVSDEEMGRRLTAGIRSLEMLRDLWREDLERLERGERGLYFLGQISRRKEGAAGIVMPPVAGASVALAEEFARLDEVIFQIRLKYSLAVWRKNLVRRACAEYYETWRIGSDENGACFPNAFEQRLPILMRIVETVAADPPLPVKPDEEYGRWGYVAGRLCDIGYTAFCNEWESHAQSDVLNAASKKWIESPSPYLRMIACASLVIHHAGANTYGPRFVDEFTRNFPDDHPARTKESDPAFFVALASYVISSMSAQGVDTKLIEETCRRFVGGCIERKDAQLLDRWDWNGIIESWFKSLETQERWRDEDELLAKMIDIVRQSDRPLICRQWLHEWEQRRKVLAEKLRAMPVSQATIAPQLAADGWSDYDISVIKLDRYVAPMPNYWQPTLVRDNRLYSVRPEAGALHALAYALPQGGAPVLDVQLNLSATKRGPGGFALRGLACSDKALYAATASGVAAFPLDGGKPWMANEQKGLPGSDDIQAIECHEDKLYLLMGEANNWPRFPRRAFVCYDPTACASKLIYSTTAVEPRRDMMNPNFDLQGLYSDPQRKCLWLMTQGALLRYQPERDHFDEVMATPKWPITYPSHHSYDITARQKGNFLLLSSRNEIFRLDMETMEVTKVGGKDFGAKLSGNGFPALVDGENVICRGASLAKWRREKEPREKAVPIPRDARDYPVLTGEIKIVTGWLLVLYRPGKEPAEKAVPYFHALHETAFGFLAVSSGQAWLIKRKAEVQK